MKRQQSIIIVVLLTIVGLIFWNRSEKKEFIYNEGLIFGTSYHISYASSRGEDLNTAIRQELMEVVDNSLSTFNPNSIISKINNNEAHQTDSAFEKVFITAQKISQLTNGAFDMTVAPLVNRWGFGYNPQNKDIPSEQEITEILQYIGYKKVKLEQHQVIKKHPKTQLDGSAIAKGYAVDVAAKFLESHGIKDYMVEIGGEIRVGGSKQNNQKWRLGIDRPVDDPAAIERVIDTVLTITDHAIATSGNYRQFYYKEGKRYSHTIDPISGHPVDHSLLSATVIAPDCMTADALATACMVMGAKKGIALAEQLKNIEVYFIIDDHGKYKEVFSSGMNKFLK